MMRSMYSGVSGLRVHQTKMDVIGNNIANVNTVGFKRGQVTFQEAFSQVVKGAGSPHSGQGGTNPQQIGLGLKLGSINTVHTKGATQRTDNPTDLMIDGQGYFIVSNDPKGEDKFYTRAGNFTFDLDGNLVTPGGYKLMGEFIGDDEYANYLGISGDKDMDYIKINKSIQAPAAASTTIELRGNLDARLEDDPATTTKAENIYETDTFIKDSLGNSYKVNYIFNHDTANAQWDVTAEVSPLNDPTNILSTTNGTISFNGSGNIDTNGTTTMTLDFSTVTLPNGASFGAGNDTILINLSKMTQFANECDAKAYDVENKDGQIGRSSGALTGFSIDGTGKVIASFSNGIKKELWQIRLANFDNPMGLEKAGSNFFEKTPNSGEARLGTPGNSGLGAISPGTLEMSNVDLSMEFTEMISTQRGFQANSRIITTTDEMLQELANMKR